MDENDDALIGRTIADKFRIEALLGRGAMGRVYKARQLVLKKTVALKVMRVKSAEDRTFGVRFKREASFAARLDHPNSVRVIDFGQEPDGLLYMAMDYVEGVGLDTVIAREHPLETERIVDILAQTLAVLRVAHEMGIIHRDLKPQNLLLVRSVDDDGIARETVKVCDFGVAKFLERDSKETEGFTPSGVTQSHSTQLTQHGMTVGTPAYMSPEQALGEPMDARSDLYAVGVILFEMLTGRLPFEAASPLKMMLKHVHDQPPRPSSLEPQVDRRLEEICLRALAKARDQRFASARDMRAELLRDSGPLAAEERTSRTIPPRARRPSRPESSGGTAAVRPEGRARALTLTNLGLAVIALALAVAVLVLALR